MQSKKFTAEVGGRTLTAEFTDMAHQANGSCLITYGGTVILATAVQSKNAREGTDFFPLTVDYEEKFYAAGMILGSRFMRREGKASDEAVLVSRLIDRSIRPLFSQKTRNEVQVIILALSIDEDNDPDILSILGASLALGTSNIPWAGPIGAVRIGKKDGKLIINPSYSDRLDASLDTVICGKDGKVNMIEAGALEISEDEMMEALETASREIDKLCDFQKKIISELGEKKNEIKLVEAPADMKEMFKKNVVKKLEESIYIKEKLNRYEALNQLKKGWVETCVEFFPEVSKSISDGLFEEAIDEIVHKNIIEKEKRPDGRGTKEIRKLFAKAGLFPRTHGSGLFYRGETHILSITTLGAPSDVQLIEGMEIRAKKRFMHHYNFPPFSVGEIKPMRGPARRDIGHGALAERALLAIIPKPEDFPYTIRVVSETLSSNGSSSMGSVTAGALSLMDAGVPIKAPAAGIAMGLMLSEAKSASGGMDDYRYKILTDIQGPEDHHGDMDFKVAGTKDGITAVQMDVKVAGIPLKIMKEVFLQAREARIQILEVVTKELHAPRPELSEYAPRILTMHINPDKIRDVIGPGGKMIQSIIAETGTEIDIEQDGTIFITATNPDGMKAAEAKIQMLTKEFVVGETFEGKITRIFPFGAMVEIGPKQEGLVHISELAPFRVNQVTDVVSPGDEVKVKVVGIDDQGRVNLSIKAAMELKLKSPEARASGESEARRQQDSRERRDGGGFGGRGGGHRR
ncbi:polyribonucleotide nucleotidyltransferase [Candidatus Giovannonibacteria bacterium RIFCSPHIGHO2_02_43_13]|uniref:Polyribonucleotide nucleotidyltransferase n=1 Tax=Candidatus Giovannonibacteria bacterium RIFCSPHIGHO2_02_43_13 TaxID=1798330 RepID=A0A1F5WRD8_9BACT|nr:MAG: Polyribonucleotide nucleotidyltransferase [Parcubacteria group bacterium GW2011_GWA2_44_13]OGF73920.1 MAG: polyribonucleotide nucleotidyltransferase [Candidatus Giovannonibacteria bacterium RIFCSPHIGHO2_12_FULL_44_42]OGF77811.1 MAG: polyribonucleotide nucleotidyltransferase [Candidatus Giovannonibacteria bacterium RIFCSPHIGHO2_02_43_13]OGF88854.1 MAG: polyribonucleotide nucleotidyltransferase [Candidatus Giovannonibacteria bacterium RIFCSPLOWO2_02_FULL_43_54]OGF96818.1 MAG: polyribonucl